MLGEGLPPDTLFRWNAYLPAAVAAVGPDPELVRAEHHLQRGLVELGATP
jgi:hypothetical protein